MPVGTQATVKTLLPEEVRATGAQIILANTYHLMLRPGLETLVAAGGLHRFMGWDGPILTDSGGFQIFSLAGNVRVRENGVTFRSHIDGSPRELTPETAVTMQLGWGSDVVMALDHLVGLPAELASVRDATDRTHRWLARCIGAFADLGGEEQAALFGICQGGMDPQLRRGQRGRNCLCGRRGLRDWRFERRRAKARHGGDARGRCRYPADRQTEVLDGRRFT